MQLKAVIKREDLLERVKKAREAHVEQYKKAKASWKKKLLAAAQAIVDAGERVRKYPGVLTELSRMPTCHTASFDRAIKLLELTVEEQIALEPHDFDKLIMGKWSWRETFVYTNAAYGVTGPTGPTGPTGEVGYTGTTGAGFDEDGELVDRPDELIVELANDELEPLEE